MGLVALVGSGVAALASPGSGDEPASGPRLTAAAVGGAEQPTSRAQPAAPAVVLGPTSLPATDPSGQAADPVRVRIPALDVDAPVGPLAVSGGVLPGPEDFSATGWWQAGPEPGETGAAVIAGHVDSYRGPAVFFALRELAPGDPVEVERADGSTVTFEVTGSERFPKQAIPLERVFGRTSAPTLRLITCGGAFDHESKSYDDNLVVYAALR